MLGTHSREDCPNWPVHCLTPLDRDATTGFFGFDESNATVGVTRYVPLVGSVHQVGEFRVVCSFTSFLKRLPDLNFRAAGHGQKNWEILIWFSFMDGAMLKHQMVVSPTDSKARYPDDASVKFCRLGYDLELKFNANLTQAQL